MYKVIVRNIFVCSTLIAVMTAVSCERSSERTKRQRSERTLVIPSIDKGVSLLKLGKEERGWKAYSKRDRDVVWADANFILHGISRKKLMTTQVRELENIISSILII